jgi:hypothetical protein
MPRDIPQPPDRPSAGAQQAAEPSTGEPLGFARLARQIRSRTTDLIAIAVVVVLGLTVGRQLVDWWATEPADLMSAVETGQPAVAWGAGESPVIIETGDRPYALQRQVVAGDQDRALAVSIENCRRGLRSGEFPQHAPDSAEQRLLEQLERQEPIDELPGGGRIYRIKQAFPMFAGTRAGLDDSAKNSSNPGPTTGRRVVCWTLAFPSGSSAWTVFTYYPTTNSRGAVSPTLPQIVLPAGSRRVLSLRDEAGGALIAFAGVGPAEVWAHEFDQWCRAEGGVIARDWERSETSWTARYRFGAGEHPTWIDIHIRPGEAGQLSSGMLSIAAPADRATKRDDQ